MATHFQKFKGLKNNMAKVDLPQKYMQQMVVREHVDKTKNLHPDIKTKWNEMTKQPAPLSFKLHGMEAIKQKQYQGMNITSEHL